MNNEDSKMSATSGHSSPTARRVPSNPSWTRRPQSANMTLNGLDSLITPGLSALSSSWHPGLQSSRVTDAQDHPVLQMLDELMRLSSLEMGMQRKTELLGSLKMELIQLLKGQREKDLRYVEMEEALHQVAGEKSASENAMQSKVDQLSKDIKTMKKKSDQFASEASQLGLQLRGVREELRVEKERSKAISEHVGLLKESVDQKQLAILEMKRKLDTERSAGRDLRQRLESTERAIAERTQEDGRVKAEQTKQRNYQTAKATEQLQARLTVVEERLAVSKASEAALTAKLAAAEAELQSNTTQVSAVAKPWLSPSLLATQCSPLACVQGMESRCVELRERAEESQQLAQEMRELHHSLAQSVQCLTTTVRQHCMANMGSTTGDSLSEEAYLEHLSGLVHAIATRQPLLQVASGENSSTTSGDSEVEDETSNSVQTMDPVSILSASLVELLSDVKQRLQSSSIAYSQLCQVLLANCSAVGIDTDGEERDQVTRIFDRLKKAESTAKDLSERVVTLEHDHEVAMRGALSALRSDNDQRAVEAVRVAREEEKEAGLREKEAALEELRQQHLAAMQVEEGKLSDLKQEREKAEMELVAKDAEIEALNTNMAQLQSTTADNTATIEQLRLQLVSEEESHKTQLEKSEKEREAVQVVSSQHALTIVAMEKKLVKAMAKISSLETTLAECRRSSASAAPGSTSHPSTPASYQTNTAHLDAASDEGREETGLTSPDGGAQENGQPRGIDSQEAKIRQMEEDLAKMEHVVQVLRPQYSLSLKECESLQSKVKELQLQLATNQEEAETMRAQLCTSHKEELADLNKRLSAQEEEICQKAQVVHTLQASVDEKSGEVRQLQDTVRQLQEEQRNKDSVSPSSSAVALSSGQQRKTLLSLRRPRTAVTELQGGGSTLHDIGAVCVSDRHSQVIQQQKQTIRELRKKMTEMKEANPPTPNQLSLLHKAQELSYKLHTLQGSHERLASTVAAQIPPGTEAQTQTLGVADQLSPQDCEDMQNALECSEHMLTQLLTQLAQCLSFEPAPPKRSAVHVSPSERSELIKERRKFVKLLIGQVEKLVKILQTKEKLLEGSRKDLKQLQVSQQERLLQSASTATLAEEQSKRVKELSEELVSVQEELDQQRRLNETLVRRKRLSEDAQKKKGLHSFSHTCMVAPEVAQHKLDQQQKSHAERMKKKNIQITGLQKELQVTAHKLEATAMRLKAVEGKR